MRTKRHEGGKLPEGLGISLEEDARTFADLPEEIARRFVFALLQESAHSANCYRGDGWQLFSLTSRFPNGYEAVDVDIRSEQDSFRIYLNPTLLILLPLTTISRSQLYAYRSLFRIVAESDKQRIEEWGHSSHPGWIGLFWDIDATESVASSETITQETPVLLKRTPSAEEILRYPAFALRVAATRDEVEALSLTKQQRRETQPLPYFRFRSTLNWANKLFPNETLSVNDRQLAVESRVRVFQQPLQYPQKTKQISLYYPESQLLFDSKGSKTDKSQISGLKKYGPFDQNSQTKPFNQMQPYLIIPSDSQLIEKTNQFLRMLAAGYRKRPSSDFPDDDFAGISPTQTFRTKFIPPGSEDIVTVDGTRESYVQAAHDVLRRWTTNEDRNQNRVVVVVVPSLYNQDTEDTEDPYLKLKKVFIEGGLPSQMIEAHKLNGVIDTSVAFGHLLWTFALDLYVKMGGKPWTLLRPMENVNCLIGLGFGRDTQNTEKPIYVGIANVFDEGGQWLSLTSDDRELTEHDLSSIDNKEHGVAGTRSFKLHHELTHKITTESLRTYATPYPGRTATKVVLHKNGQIYDSEALGFLQAFARNMEEQSTALSEARFALVSIYKNHSLRMYEADNPSLKWPLRTTVTRGTVCILSENSALVATTGKSDYGYAGIGTPKPILIERFLPSVEVLESVGLAIDQMYSVEEICEQIMALTKLHWGTTRNIRLPVTSEYAQRIAGFVAKSKIRVDSLLQWKKLWWI